LPPPFRYVVFDCETTGLPSSRAQPHLVQLAWSVHEPDGTLEAESNYIVKPVGYTIPESSTRIHGITHKHAMEVGAPLRRVLENFFATAMGDGVRLVAHNVAFDIRVLDATSGHVGLGYRLAKRPQYCTMRSTTQLCAIPKIGGGFKWPSLQELHLTLFGKRFQGAHNAISDVRAAAKCFSELRRRRHVMFR
jgi:DNA polymerase III epsilon subunit-like protein